MARFSDTIGAAVTALLADGGIAAIVSTRVYTLVPQKLRSSGDFLDYLKVSASNDDQWDTKGTAGFLATLSVDYWTQSRKGNQVDNMLELIYDLFHKQPLTLATQQSVVLTFEGSDNVTEKDSTQHGVINFNHMIAE